MDERFFSMEWSPQRREVNYHEVVPVSFGEARVRSVNNQTKYSIPFIGTDHSGDGSKLGIGMLFPRESGVFFSGFATNRWLIQSWRAMKLLDGLNSINEETPKICLLAMDPVKGRDEKLLLILMMEVDDLDFINRVIEIATIYPTEKEILSMVKILKDRKIDVDIARLKRELGDIYYAKRVLDLVRKEEIKL